MIRDSEVEARVEGAVSWQSRLQNCVALSTTKFEPIAVVEACKELLWMKRFLGELGCAQERIQKLKQELSKSFAMKDLGPARQILGMLNVRDRKARKLVLSQEKYIQKVLCRFSMDKAKVVCTPLAMHFKLSTKQCPSSDDEKEDMKKVAYASAVDMASDVDTRKSTSREGGDAFCVKFSFGEVVGTGFCSCSGEVRRERKLTGCGPFLEV
uniref:Reverse transcriptase Ty1/copia-type domain-containing protein n=1 Tax=Solanum lycopersicum TaxID=4081 RepID=A0A3Q7ED15_SOLLC